MSKPPEWLRTPAGHRRRDWDVRWRAPWTVPRNADEAEVFKRVLWENGRASPNFSRREMGGEDRHPEGGPVPDALRARAQFHAFGLERVRHDLGDRPMTPSDAYRTAEQNAAVGGAANSRHLRALATDWSAAERERLGGEDFDRAMERHFKRGGRGYRDRIGGPVRHVDDGRARAWVCG